MGERAGAERERKESAYYPPHASVTLQRAEKGGGRLAESLPVAPLSLLVPPPSAVLYNQPIFQPFLLYFSIFSPVLFYIISAVYGVYCAVSEAIDGLFYVCLIPLNQICH
jgi:hypothetical protein